MHCRRVFFQNADEGSNTYSTPNSGWEVLTHFKSGDEVELDVLMADYQRVRISCKIQNSKFRWQNVLPHTKVKKEYFILQQYYFSYTDIHCDTRSTSCAYSSQLTAADRLTRLHHLYSSIYCCFLCTFLSACTQVK